MPAPHTTLRTLAGFLAGCATLAALGLGLGCALVIADSIRAARGLGWSDDTGGLLGTAALILFVGAAIAAAERQPEP